MKLEYDALMANQTWVVIRSPPYKQVFRGKWVFRVKENPDESVNKYKPRLVEKTYH